MMERETFVFNVGWTLLHFLWQGAALAGCFGIADHALARRSANARYAAACFTLVLMLLAPVVTFAVLTCAAANASHVTERANRASEEAGALDANRGFDAERAAAEQFALTASGGDDAAKVASASNSLRRWIEWRAAQLLTFSVCAWAAGVLLLLARFGGGWLRIRRLRKRSTLPAAEHWQATIRLRAKQLRLSRPIKLCQSALVEVPSVIGWLRPVILVPASTLIGLTPAQAEAILVHELMHIRRHDYLVNLVQTQIEILLFYHPAVWWVSGRVRQEREHACDDLTVRFCDGDRLMYACALADLEGLRRLSGAAHDLPSPGVAANGGGNLMSRIQRLVLIDAHRASATAGLPLCVLSFVMLLCAVIAGGTLVSHPTTAIAQSERSQKAKTPRTRKIAVGFVALPALPQENLPSESPAEATRLLIEKLTAHRVPAIGYVQGGRVAGDARQRIELLRLWRDAGLELGVGTQNHLWFYDTPFDKYAANLTSTEEVVRPLMREAGKELRYFSYPYLNTGVDVATKNRFEEFLKTRNLKFTPYTIDNDDWFFSKVYAEARARDDKEAMQRIRAEYVPYMTRMFEFYEAYAQELFGRDISQVLLLTPSRLNADAFGDLTAMLENRGYRFVTMDEVTADRAFASPDTYTGRTGISWLQRWAITRGGEWRAEPRPGGYMERFNFHKGDGNLKAKK